MPNRIKNLISFLAFILFIIIGVNIFISRYSLKLKSQEIANKYLKATEEIIEVATKEVLGSTILDETNNIIEETSITIDDNEKLTNVYDNNDLLDVSKYEKDEKILKGNEQLFEEYKKYLGNLNSDSETSYYDDNKEYINSLYKKICFIGDSNVLKIRRLGYLPRKNIYPFGAEMLKDIIAKADNFKSIDVRKFDCAVIWIGYNIKYIENSEHFISEYNRLIEKLKNQNPDIKVYVCSLLPATKAKIDEDIANGAIHNFYKGVEYDAALKEHFDEEYINTKVFIKSDGDYTGDGFHMQPHFYDKMIPYVGFYINFMNIKS